MFDGLILLQELYNGPDLFYLCANPALPASSGVAVFDADCNLVGDSFPDVDAAITYVLYGCI